jgi:hypothetical protein
MFLWNYVLLRPNAKLQAKKKKAAGGVEPGVDPGNSGTTTEASNPQDVLGIAEACLSEEQMLGLQAPLTGANHQQNPMSLGAIPIDGGEQD